MARLLDETRPRPREAEANRGRIAAAARVAPAEGPQVPVEEIARRAGVGRDAVPAVCADGRPDRSARGLVRRVRLRGRAGHHRPGSVEALRSLLERAPALHAANRSLNNLVVTRAHGRSGAEAIRERIWPLMRRPDARAHEGGIVRTDLTAADLSLILVSGSRLVEAASAVAPGFWHRFLDGQRGERATPLPHPPLDRARLSQRAGRRPS